MLHLSVLGGKWASGQYCVRAERRVSAVGRLFKILQQIYARNKRRYGEEERWKEGNDANKLRSERESVKMIALCRTYAVSGPCRKWHVAVRMSAYAVLREKPIRVESFGIRKVFGSPVQDVRQNSYVSAGRNDVITCLYK